MILEKVFASTLGDAKLTALGLANTIFQLPLGVFAASLVLPLFPLMTEQVKKLQWDELRKTVQNGFLIQYHLLLPMSVAMMIMPGLIVKTLYDHGEKFTQSDVDLTAWALLFISTGMIGWIGRDLMTRVYYALEDTKTPVIVATAGFIAYALFAWIFIPLLDHAALAFSYALTSTLNMLVLAFLLTRRISHLFNRTFFISILRGGLAAAIMSLAIVLVRGQLSLTTVTLETAILALVGATIYILSLLLMKEPILVLIGNKLRRRS
jgi:putative peptidoglycan lipid II flippase